MAERSIKAKATDDAAEQVLQKLLSCSVCREEYHKPRVLPCLHVFCEACLEKLVENRHDKMTALCPNCRKPAPLPDGGVSSLPSAFHIQHHFEVREALEKVCNPTKAQCDKCGEVEVQGFCRDCGQFICQPCLEIHQKWREFQSHEISSLNDVQETVSKMVTLKKVTTMCDRHPAEPIKIYCETCEELICRDCTVKIHRDHSYDLIPDTFPKHRDSILSFLHPMKTELANVAGAITELRRRSTKLDHQGLKAKGRVDAEVDKLHAILEAHRRDWHCEIDGVVCQGKKELAARINKHEFRQAQLSSCVGFVEGSLQSGTHEEVLSIKKQVEQRMQQITAEFKTQHLQLGPEKVLYVTCTDLTPQCETLARVKFKSHFEGTHINTISEIEEPRHIAFATTGEMVVCDRYDNSIKVFCSSFKKTGLHIFGNTGPEESQLTIPVGVAISSDNTVFVVSCHCVKKFTLEGQFIAAVGSEGCGQLQFQFPWAIAYNGTNNRLYVCDTGNHCISILNHDLTFHDSFGSKGCDADHLDMPAGISVDSKGNVLIADYNNNRIQVFDTSDHYLSSITHTAPGERLQGPISVAVGPDDWVYVVEFSLNRVSVFDENYNYIKSFGKRGDKDGELNEPYAIAVDDDGCAYVSDTGNNRVQVFK